MISNTLALRRAASCHVFFFFPTRADAAQTRADSGQIRSYRPNISVFRPEKGNRPVREIKKKNLKPKILVDLIRCRRLHRLNPFLLLLLFCFFFFFFASSSSSCFFFAALPFCSVSDSGRNSKTSPGRIGL